MVIRHLTTLPDQIEARDYLPHMYGPVNRVLVDNVARSPLNVADIYRRLTT